MSYALRNTLILLTTLVLIVLGGWLYIKYNMNSVLIEQETQITQKQRDFNRFQAKADDFLPIQDRHARIRFEAENHPKELFANNSVATIFDFLRSINRGLAYTTMNFALRDSVIQPNYGIVRVRLDGEGTYRGLFNFLSVLEHSKPITRITEIRIAPVGRVEDLNRVNFEMNVDFYYARGTTKSNPDLLINTNITPFPYNPMRPLLHGIPPNTLNQTDVERSTIVGLTNNGAYLIDQNREFKFIPLNGQVYLGSLQSINMNEGTATFRLNKGGIAEVVVRKINETD